MDSHNVYTARLIGNGQGSGTGARAVFIEEDGLLTLFSVATDHEKYNKLLNDLDSGITAPNSAKTKEWHIKSLKENNGITMQNVLSHLHKMNIH